LPLPSQQTLVPEPAIVAGEKARLRTEQVRQLYHSYPVVQVATAVNSLILAFILRDAVNPKTLIFWLISMAIVIVVRALQHRYYRQSGADAVDAEPWRKRFIVGAALSGMAWGSAGIILFPTQSLAHQTFLIFVLGGMAAGAATTYAVMLEVFFAYAIPSLAPVILRLVLANGEVHVAMAGMVLLFAVLISIVAKQVNSVTLLSFRLQFRNSDLIASLTASVEEKERLNRELSESREHLSQQVKERTADLMQINKRLLQEIDERKKAEAAVKHTAVYYQSLIEHTIDIISVLGTNGTILYESPSVQKALGYGETEIVGRNAFEFLHPEDHAAAREALARVTATPGTVASIEVRFKHQNGEWRTLEVVGKAVAEASGAVNIVVNARDITDRRRMEEHLRRSQKLESLGLFAGGLAHDLNNILTGILGNVDIASMDLDPAGKAYQRLAAAKAASVQAGALAKQLLTFAKGGEPVKKTIAPGDFIADTIRFVLHGSAVSCEFSVPDDLWSIDADEGQLAQVISNVALNALQAMPRGGIIRVRGENLSDGSALSIGLKQRKYIKITIKDEGVGIPKEQLNKIFDPYFTTKHEGNGLGLAISYSIIKRHDGLIIAESEPGMGAVISIYLMASRTAVSQLEKTSPEPPAEGHGKVLVMDDEEMVRTLAGEILEQIGYEVVCTREGKEAVAAYTAAREVGKPFDVVIMDLTVRGGMGGKEAVAEILTVDPRAKVIVSSGYSGDTVMAHYEEYGFAAAVSKPYSVDNLADAVHRLITAS
jgi:two-component system cell cycle sensor histidine kinase/response regulator CckA